MKGILIDNGGVLVVKWSDLHSFAYGTHWSYTDLHPESKSISYIENDKVLERPLKPGDEVDFEFVASKSIDAELDIVSYNPHRYAKLVFPKVIEKQNNENWFESSFQEQLLVAHRAVLFPEEMNKNKKEFLIMIIQRLIDKTDKMSNDDIDKFLGYE